MVSYFSYLKLGQVCSEALIYMYISILYTYIHTHIHLKSIQNIWKKKERQQCLIISDQRAIKVELEGEDGYRQ